LDDGLEAVEQQPVSSSATENEARILACGSDLVARSSIGSDLAAGEDQGESQQHHQQDQQADEGAPDGSHQNPPNSQSIATNDTSISNGRLDMTSSWLRSDIPMQNWQGR
jgi:hypothetical protein